MEFLAFINWTNPFTILGLLGSNFKMYSNFKSIYCKQTVQNLIRCRFPRHLIWFCTVCQCPIKRTPGLNGLKRSVDHSLHCPPVRNWHTMLRLRHTNAETMYGQNVREHAWSQKRIEQNRPERRNESPNHHADNPDLKFPQIFYNIKHVLHV